MSIRNIPGWYYQQFDADYSLDIPAEGFGGWKKTDLNIDPDKTAVVVMHAWDCGRYEDYPGWHRAVEYIPRAENIAKNIFPKMLSTLREKGIKIYHVVHDEGYVKNHPGYLLTKSICSKYSDFNVSQKMPSPVKDISYKWLKDFMSRSSYAGSHNERDIKKGFEGINFMKEAMPLYNELIAKDSFQLHSVCLNDNINHLVYTGFAINWCLQYSPGNMNDMSDRGFICSTIKEAVTAVENKESARNERHKEYGLWLTAVKNGFVFEIDDLLNNL